MNVIFAFFLLICLPNNHLAIHIKDPAKTPLLGIPPLQVNSSQKLKEKSLNEIYNDSLSERRLSDNHSHDHDSHLNQLIKLQEYEMFSVEPKLFETKDQFFAPHPKKRMIIDPFDPEIEKNQAWFPGNIYFGQSRDFTPNFETYEIFEAVNLIEFKMVEMNFLVKECIRNMFANNLLVDPRLVKESCVGVNFQIIFQNYEEGMRKMRAILIELLHLKFAKLSAQYRDVKEHFFKTLNGFMLKDLYLPESLQVAGKSSTFYTSRADFESLVRLAKPEIEAFDTLHKKMRAERKEIQELLEHEIKQQRKSALNMLHGFEDLDYGSDEEDEEIEDHDDHHESKHEEFEESAESKSSQSSGSESSMSSASSSSSSSSSSSETGGHHHHHHHASYDSEKKDKEDDEFDEKDEKEEKEVKPSIPALPEVSDDFRKRQRRRILEENAMKLIKKDRRLQKKAKK